MLTIITIRNTILSKKKLEKTLGINMYRAIGTESF